MSIRVKIIDAIAKKDTQVKKLQPRPVVARGVVVFYVHNTYTKGIMGIIYTQKAHKPKVTDIATI